MRKFEKTGEVRAPITGEWFSGINGPAQAMFDFSCQKFPILELKSIPEKSIPDNAVCFFKDGDSWCCVHADFINLQESPAGFGNDFVAALDDLKSSISSKASPQEGRES